jgi:hypothetical protein
MQVRTIRGRVPGGSCVEASTLLPAMGCQAQPANVSPFSTAGPICAGKYVPSIAHYILQAQADGQPPSSEQQRQANLDGSAPPRPELRHRRALPAELEAPAFTLAGIAIGNGLTDPRAQTATLAPTAWYQGLASSGLRDALEARASQVGAFCGASPCWQQVPRQYQKHAPSTATASHACIIAT